MAEERRRNPVATGWMVAIVGLVIALLLGWLLMSIGARRLEAARKTREPLRAAVSFMATEAVASAREAASGVAANNWGEAQQRLTRVNEVVTAMERARSDENRRQIDRVRAALSRAQTSVGQQSGDARNDVEQLISALEDLQVR